MGGKHPQRILFRMIVLICLTAFIFLPKMILAAGM